MCRLILGLLLWLPAGRALAQNAAELSGEVNRATTDSVAVSWRAQPFDAREQTVAVRLDAKGRFRLRVPLTGPVAARLVCGSTDAPLFLEPGDALRLHFRADEMLTSLRFESADRAAHKPAAAANNYLAEAEATFADNEGYQVLPENIQLFEKPFLEFLRYRREQQLALLRHQPDFTPIFAAYARAEIDYLYANDRLGYPELREQVVSGEAPPKLSPDYYNFARDPALLAAAAAPVSSEQAREFLLGYVHHQVQAGGTTRLAPSYFPACYQLARQQLAGPLRSAVLGQLISETIRFGHVAHATALLADFATLAPPAWAAILTTDLAAHRAHAIGAPAPPLPLHTATGDTLPLASYTGQVLYVMFWDSRRPLAQREMPFLKEMVSALNGQPVAFLTVALDPDSAAWTRNVGALPAAVTHAWVPTRQQAAVWAAYGLEQLPAFLLLDEQGHILDPRAKRLSSRALLDDLRASPGRAAAYQAVPLPR